MLDIFQVKSYQWDLCLWTKYKDPCPIQHGSSALLIGGFHCNVFWSPVDHRNFQRNDIVRTTQIATIPGLWLVVRVYPESVWKIHVRILGCPEYIDNFKKKMYAIIELSLNPATLSGVYLTCILCVTGLHIIILTMCDQFHCSIPLILEILWYQRS